MSMYIHNLSAGKESEKISLKPVTKRLAKSVMIMVPILFFSIIALAEDVPNLAKSAKGLSKMIKNRKKTRRALTVVKKGVKTTGTVARSSTCLEGFRRIYLMTLGPISLPTAVLAYLMILICVGFLYATVIDE